MPEVGHGRLHLQDAACELLAGDGWDAYVKPFRSLEDLYVLAALTAWLYGVGQECGWPQELRLRLLGLLAGCAEGSRQCPDSVGCHLLLGDCFRSFRNCAGQSTRRCLPGRSSGRNCGSAIRGTGIGHCGAGKTPGQSLVGSRVVMKA